MVQYEFGKIFDNIPPFSPKLFLLLDFTYVPTKKTNRKLLANVITVASLLIAKY